MTSIRLAVTEEEKAAYAASPYYAVSITKLVVLSLCTFGLYELYWCYAQWARERSRTGESLSPILRAIFSPIWTFSLFDRINKRSMSSRIAAPWSANAAALGYLILTLVANLPDPYWLIALLSFVPFVPVQATINALNAEAAPAAEKNTAFTGAEGAITAIGGLLLFLAVWGTLFPVE